MTTHPAPICVGCVRFHGLDPNTPGAPALCDAFPKGIPTEIIDSEVDHRAPYSGDHDLQFLPRDLEAERYADDLMTGRERAAT